MSASLLSGVAVVLACAAATVQASDPKYDYKVSQRPMHQDDAKQWCSDNFDGWLATISDGDEKRDVEKAVSESGIAVDYFWLSLERKQNPVRWYAPAPLSPTAAHPPLPFGPPLDREIAAGSTHPLGFCPPRARGARAAALRAHGSAEHGPGMPG